MEKQNNISLDELFEFTDWLRNDNLANNFFNYRGIKENGKPVTTKELFDTWVLSRVRNKLENIPSDYRKYPLTPDEVINKDKI